MAAAPAENGENDEDTGDVAPVLGMMLDSAFSPMLPKFCWPGRFSWLGWILAP